jgi:hypothetical protein
VNNAIIKLLAERYFGRIELSDWAIKCLEIGYDSKCLRILASTSKSDSDSELQNYFERSLKELSWDNAYKTDYLLRYAKIVAQEIVENKVDPIKTSLDVYRIFVELDYPSELNGWIDINEMIWDYEYFLKTGIIGHFYRSKEELIGEIKKVSEQLIKSDKV